MMTFLKLGSNFNKIKKKKICILLSIYYSALVNKNKIKKLDITYVQIIIATIIKLLLTSQINNFISTICAQSWGYSL